MGFYITEDCFFEGFESMVNLESSYEGGELYARVKDENEIIHYYALCDGIEGASAFYDWAVGHGCVEVDVQINERWYPVIRSEGVSA